MSRVFTLVLCLVVAGCSTVGRIKTKAVSVFAVKDAGRPAQVDENHEVAVFPLPAGTKAVMTSFAATPGQPATESTPAIAPQPGRTVTEFILEKPTEWRKTGTYIKADTGVVDTTVAMKRIAVAENRILLYAAMGAAGLGLIFRYIQFPTPANLCFAASVVFLIAWKVAGLPEWFWAVGACAIVGGILLWRGYERREAEEKEHAEELAKAKAIAVPAAPPIPVVVTNPPTTSP